MYEIGGTRGITFMYLAQKKYPKRQPVPNP